MGEVIVALIEGIVALTAAMFEFMAVAFEVLLNMAVAAFTLIAYACSPRYRAKKQQEWATNPRRRYLDLGLGTVCLLSLLALGIWIALPAKEPPPSETVFHAEKPAGDEEARVRIKSTTKDKTNEVTLVIKQGGLKKIMETGTLLELREALRTNVSVVPKHGITNPALSTNALVPEVVEK